MTLKDLNNFLTARGLQKAVKYACDVGVIHYKRSELESQGTIRRVSLHINDDGTAYIVLHGTPFEGREAQ